MTTKFWQPGASTTAALALVAIALAMPPGPSAAQQYTMKIGTATINDIQHEWMKRFQSRMHAKAGNRVKVQLFPSSQLGKIPRMVEGMQLGTNRILRHPVGLPGWRRSEEPGAVGVGHLQVDRALLADSPRRGVPRLLVPSDGPQGNHRDQHHVLRRSGNFSPRRTFAGWTISRTSRSGCSPASSRSSRCRWWACTRPRWRSARSCRRCSAT